MNDMPKQKRERLSGDEEFLKKLVSILEKEKLTKDELATKLDLDSPKKINDRLLLSAVKLSGSSSFLSNIIEKSGGIRAKKGAVYSSKKGLTVPLWMLQEKGITDGQKYEMSYGIRTGIITLKPIVNKDADDGDDE